LFSPAKILVFMAYFACKTQVQQHHYGGVTLWAKHFVSFLFLYNSPTTYYRPDTLV